MGTLENKFPQKSDDEQSGVESDLENQPETTELEQEIPSQEDQVEQASPETPEIDPGVVEQTSKEGVETARQNLDAAFGQTDQTAEEPIADQEETPQAEVEEPPEEKYQSMINAAKQQYDQDSGIETVPSEEVPEEAENAPEELNSEQEITEAQQEIVAAAEAVEGDLENSEMTPEMEEYVAETQQRMEKELDGLDIPEEGTEKKERPKRGALKKAMLVLTAAAALWMFQASVMPDTAEAKSKQTRIEKLQKKEAKRIAREKKRLQKMPEKMMKGVSKDIQRTLNGISKDFIKGIFN